MPYMPAVCDNCGTIFSSGVFLNNAAQVTFKENKAGPCPKYGKMGHIPDGIFSFFEDVVEILKAPERTIREMRTFMRLLEDAKVNSKSPGELQENVNVETPALSPILDLLPKDREEKREDIKWGIEILLQIL